MVPLPRPLFVLLAGTLVSCGGRSPQPAADRGQRVLDAALAALGGAERVRGIATWDIEGRGRENLSAEAQGMAADRPTWREHEERVVVDARTLAVAWQRRTPRNDYSLRWRRMIYRADGTGVVDLASGRAGMQPAAADTAERRTLARRVPHLLLLEAATNARSVAWRGEQRMDGALHDRVAVSLADGAELLLTLGRSPAVLRRLESRILLPTRGEVAVVWEWQGWRPDAALGQRPSRHRIDIDGVTFQEVDYTRYAANADIEAMLQMDDAGRAAGSTGAPVAPARDFASAGEVAPGVHIRNIAGFVVMLVELDTFMVAVETPESHPGFERIPAARPPRTVAAEHAAWARETGGTKPVRYVVVSHHHSDHMGGVTAFGASDVTLLVATADTAAARRAAGAAVRMEGVADRRVIHSGGRRIEIRNVGPNPHTDENLLVWLPDERILFQGDLFYYAQNGPFPPPGRETMNRFLAAWLEANDMRPEAIYGVHNVGAASAAALARSLGG